MLYNLGMTPDIEAFIRAIADSPGDDTARLVFADYLDEHGEPERAKLIRVQCRGDPAPELLRLIDLPDGWGFETEPYVTVSRGLLSRVCCSWEEWQVHGDRILSDPWTPGLDCVELTTWPQTRYEANPDQQATMLELVGHGVRIPWGPVAGSPIRDLLTLRWPGVRSWELRPV